MDDVKIRVAAGRGGDGSMSFYRARRLPRGGPDGGDGGRGGNVRMKVSRDVGDLSHLVPGGIYQAPQGAHGKGQKMAGRDARDLVIDLPVGTIVEDAGQGMRLADLCEAGQALDVARGGRGGRGNSHFATSTHQSPREYEKGAPGEIRRLRLDFRMPVDIALVGLGGSGKSALLNRLAGTRVPEGAYPCSTAEPVCGVWDAGLRESWRVAEIPSLMPGRHGPGGPGTHFLKHLTRARAVWFVLDGSADGAAGVFRRLREWVSPFLDTDPPKRIAVVLTRTDLRSPEDEGETLRVPAIPVSLREGRGLDALRTVAPG
ncbi:MAG: GTPase [Planctomycetota bacterium]